MDRSTDPNALISGFLDDDLSDAEQAALNDWVKADPEHARRFASALMLHGRLRDRFQALADLEREGLAPRPGPRKLPSRVRPRPVWRRRLLFLAGAAGAASVLLLIVQNLSGPRVSAAEAQLERLIATARRAGDRTYRITALDPGTTGDAEPRGRARASINGALLHVRDRGQYVLVRPTDQAEPLVTGSNGREAWSIPPDGPVRVSDDPLRFRGAVPGEQQDLPFLDLTSSLSRLRDAYNLELPAPDASAPAPTSASPRRLVARKRSSSFRGPRLVAITFDAATGTIERMLLDGLPQARGGPRGLTLELVDEQPLAPDFFEHQHHHAPDRRIVRDPREAP